MDKNNSRMELDFNLALGDSNLFDRKERDCDSVIKRKSNSYSESLYFSENKSYDAYLEGLVGIPFHYIDGWSINYRECELGELHERLLHNYVNNLEMLKHIAILNGDYHDIQDEGVCRFKLLCVLLKDIIKCKEVEDKDLEPLLNKEILINKIGKQNYIDIMNKLINNEHILMILCKNDGGKLRLKVIADDYISKEYYDNDVIDIDIIDYIRESSKILEGSLPLYIDRKIAIDYLYLISRVCLGNLVNSDIILIPSIGLLEDIDFDIKKLHKTVVSFGEVDLGFFGLKLKEAYNTI